jgi:DNA-binding transcriptional MerR regulator
MKEHMAMTDKHAERPPLERYADAPVYNMKAMVQQTGVAAPTLRAWERRYAILSPQRTQHEYRLYSERDIAIIRWLKERVDAGMSISQAAALFRYLEEEHQRQEVSQPPLQSEQQSHSREITHPAPATYNMRLVQERLLAAFRGFDEATAGQLMSSILAISPIEQVCSDLIAPTLWEIGKLWEHGEVTVSVEHFASAFFHSLLTSLFHSMPANEANPLVIACCAPGEQHELGLLMLSLLLRRAGLRVTYLGQSIETAGLLQTIKQLAPALVCLSATMQSCLEAMIHLGQQVEELASPRPLLIFGGQLFERQADLAAQVPGVYLHGELPTIVTQLRGVAFQHAQQARSSSTSTRSD